MRRTNEKQLSQKINHFTIGWMVQLFSLPVFIAVAILTRSLLNPLHLGLNFWLPTIVLWIGFYPLNTYLYVNAYKEGDLSKILPLQSLGPVFALILGSLLLRQKPSLGAILAIVVIASGVYVLNLKGKTLHSPLSMFTRDRANRLTVYGLALVTLAGVLDTVAIRASNAPFYSLTSTLGAVVTVST